MRALIIVLGLLPTAVAAQPYYQFWGFPQQQAQRAPQHHHVKGHRPQAEWKAELLRQARDYCRVYPHDAHCRFLPR